MTDHIIPCETYVRLSRLLQADLPDDPWINSIRLDSGMAIVTNRTMMVVEKLTKPCNPAPLHVVVDPALVAACEAEIAFKSDLNIVANDALRFASAKTTFGYQHTGNAALYLLDANPVDRWREVVPREMPTKSKGSLCLWVDQLQHLVAASPSKQITFPSVVDWTVPVIVRDAVDDGWFGVFFVRKSENPHKAATVPGWLV